MRVQLPLVVAMSFLVCSVASAAPVTVPNHSFETDVIPRDGNPGTQSANTDDWLLSNSSTSIISNWTIFDDGRNNGNNNNYGIVSAASDSFWNSEVNSTPDADANDQAFFSAERDIYQVLTETLQANTTYTLSVDLGDRDANGVGGNPGTPIVNFGTGATPGLNILTPDTSDLPTQINGDWVTWTWTYETGPTPAGLGDALRIELTNGTNVGWFDNVRLDAVSQQVPEPASYVMWVMIAMATVASLAWSRLKERQ